MRQQSVPGQGLPSQAGAASFPEADAFGGGGDNASQQPPQSGGGGLNELLGLGRDSVLRKLQCSIHSVGLVFTSFYALLVQELFCFTRDKPP